jgi:serine protease Do
MAENTCDAMTHRLGNAAAILACALGACIALQLGAARGAETAPGPVAVGPEFRRALALRVVPSIVSVTSYLRVPEGAPPEGRWAVAGESPWQGFARNEVASGIVADAQGTILCARTPLLSGGESFCDRFDVESSAGTRFEAELIASEPTINLAVLKVKPANGQTLTELVPMKMGSVDSLQAGDDLFAFGDPFGSARTFAPGIVMSLPQASCYQADLFGSFVHASMAVSPGAVGGALVDRSGAAVAMIVPPPSASPDVRPVPDAFVTYGLQMQTALAVGKALEKKRSSTSPFLGVAVLDRAELRRNARDAAGVDAMQKPDHGLYISDVFDPSPASREGIHVGDWITDINGIKIVGVVDFQQCLYYFSGTRVPIRVFRDGKARDLFMPIESRPPEANRR